MIYKDGTVISSSNMPTFSDNQIMYTWTNRWATGFNHWRFTKENKNTEMGLLKLNHLLYRFNGDDFQGNIYVHGEVPTSITKGIGIAGFGEPPKPDFWITEGIANKPHVHIAFRVSS